MKNKMCDLKMERGENFNDEELNKKIFQKKKFHGQLLIHTFQINILNN